MGSVQLEAGYTVKAEALNRVLRSQAGFGFLWVLAASLKSIVKVVRIFLLDISLIVPEVVP